MTPEVTLLLLRLVSGLVLMLMLGALFVVMWRDFRDAAQEVEESQRTYGQLVLLHERENGYEPSESSYPLLPVTSLGRAPTNTVRIDDNFASSEHALIVMRDGQWWLEDRQSRNGTKLNEIPINQPVIVTHGDIIGIGNHRFEIEMDN